MKLSDLKTYSFELALVALALLSLTDNIPVEDKTALFATMGAVISASIKANIRKRFPQLLQGEELKPLQLEISADDSGVQNQLDQILQKLSNFPKAPLLLFCLFGGVGGIADAKEPKAIISGPRYAEPGEDIFLDFAQSEGQPDRFHVSIKPDLPGRSQLEVMDGGTRARVKSYPGVWNVRLIVSNDDGWDEYTHTITIPGNPPCPEPPPTPNPIQPLPEPPKPPGPTPTPEPKPVEPNPDPQPVAPEPGRFALAPEVFRIASTAKSSTRIPDCSRLASECRRIAEAKDNYASLNAMATDVVTVLKSLPVGWEELKTRTGAAITGLYSNGLLTNRDDLAALLLELAPAFDAAAKVK